MTAHRKSILLLVPLLVVSTLEAGTLTLSKKFVQDNKNRATIDLKLELDAHLTGPHKIGAGGDDGDVHMAGRSDQVRLPMVAEIINAGIESDSVKLMNSTADGATIVASGVWRIWFEHPSTGNQIQGKKVAVPANTNPDHVFEIHPITKFGTFDIAKSSFVPILGKTKNEDCSYHAYPAARAFAEYERQNATVSVTNTSISITAKKVGFNYAEFLLDPVGKSTPGNDGVFVLADVFDVSDPETPVTSSPRRMVFVSGTDPAQTLVDLEGKKRSGPLHVLGIPRVNLAEVAQISGNSVDVSLPYEMIVVAVLGDDEAQFCPLK
jgi:hypothetical protein